MNLCRAVVGVVAVSLLSACTTVGPRHVETDRLDYGTALSRSLQEQALLNIVKSRYSDWPSFLEVSSIVAGYSREGSASLSLDWLPETSSSNTVEPGFSGTFTESPTITFTPLVGEDFAKTLLEPLATENILAVGYAGWRVDRLFELTLSSLNGKRNAQFVGDSLQAADPEFFEALALFRDLQRANAWVLRRSPTTSTSSASGSETSKDASAESNSGSTNKTATTSAASAASSTDILEIVFRVAQDTQLQQKLTRLKSLLGLDASQNRFRVVYGDGVGAANELTIESRTLWEMIWELQRFVEAPAEDVSTGVVEGLDADPGHAPILTIHSGGAPSGDVFVAVPYRDHWFWIADSDRESKHTLSMVLLMSTLARSSDSDPPQLVIPTR